MRATKQEAFGTIERRRPEWSDWCSTVFEFGETAWREYRSAAFLADLLEREGFDVARGTARMPTAFVARWGRGGPTLATIAEYDGVPDNCQAADVVKRPRDGLGPRAGGHTDPHSALGTAAIVGMIGAKRAMERARLPGTLVVFGEPAEKVRGSKPIHAAAGFYDGLDAAISFHPFYMLPLCNTVRWDTPCGAGFAWVTRFLCETPETFPGAGDQSPIPAAHAATRAPGATDALVQMLVQTKALKEHVLPSGLSWSISETILTAGQATADNLPAPEAELLVMARVPTVEMAWHVLRLYDRVADAAAAVTHCRWERVFVAKSREGLANHAMSEVTWRNLAAVGPPRFGAEAVALANRIEAALGLEPRAEPFLPAIGRLIAPADAEAGIRAMLPAAQRHFTSDDYTEFTWHCPTSRF
jgi:aminobenzoyl-glutamate utilization protein B